MTRVLMFSPGLRPAVIGGAERQAEKLAAALAARGNEVELYTFQLDPESREVEETDGVRIVRFPFRDPSRRDRPPPGIRLWNAPYTAWQVTTALGPALGRADVLHCHIGSLPTVSAALTAGRRGVPSICKAAQAGPRSDLLVMAGKGPWTRRYGRLGRTAFDRWVATTGAVRDALLASGVHERRIVVIPNGVNVPPPGPGREAEQDRRAVRRFLYLGRLSARIDRDVPGLIEAFERVAAAEPEAELAIVGGGDRLEATRTRATEAAAADRIKVVGPDAPGAWLEWADCLVQPSRTEGLSNAILEAMAQGIPCIAYDIQPNREVLDDGTAGVLVPADDRRALAAAMTRLASDPVEARRLGDAACERASSIYAIDRVAEAYERLYARLARGRRG